MVPDQNIVAQEERGRGRTPAHRASMNRLGWDDSLGLDPPRWSKAGLDGFLIYCNFGEERFYLLAQLVGAAVTGRLREFLAIVLGRSGKAWVDW